MADWQPIETAPKDGTSILVFTVHREIEVTQWYRVTSEQYEPAGDGLYRRVEAVFSEGWNGNAPTHWMPLPDPPTPPESLTKYASGLQLEDED